MRYFKIFFTCSLLVLIFSASEVFGFVTCQDWFCDDNQTCGTQFGQCLDSGGNGGQPAGGQPPAGGGVSRTDINACCKLSQDVSFEGHSFKQGCVVGEQYKKTEQESYCLIDGKLWELTIPAEGMARPTNLGTFDCPADEGRYYKKWGMVCLLSTIHSIANWLFYLMLTITVFLACLAGYYHMTALGDPEKAGRARNVVWFALIGLILALVSRIIPAVVQVMVGN